MSGNRASDRLLSIADRLHWYALYVPPQKEFVAQEVLKRYGVETYVPVRRDWRRKNKYTKTKELRSFPLAPRYVFTGFTKGLPLWFDLFNLPLISGVVGINGHPKALNVAALMGMMRKYPSGIVAPDEAKHMPTGKEFKAGDIVRFTEGPFEGMDVPVKELKGNRAKVAMQLFGGAIEELDIPINILEAA